LTKLVGVCVEMVSIIDPLYGKIELSHGEYRLVETPELQRLREIRVCNVSFFYMSGCSGFSRFEHSLGVTYLAKRVSKILELDKMQTATLVVASLLHDIGTPPFSHTTENVLKSFFEFNHEDNAVKIIKGDIGRDDQSLFCGMPSEVPTVLRRLKEKGICDPEQVISTILGRGSLGKILNSAFDIDNIDGIARTYLHSQGHLAFDDLPLSDLLELFKSDSEDYTSFRTNPLLKKWEYKRSKLYRQLLDNPLDCAADAMLGHAIGKAITGNYFDENLWKKTDIELMSDLSNEEKMRKYVKSKKDVQEIKSLVSRLRTGKLYSPIFQLQVSEGIAKVRQMDAKTKSELEYTLQTTLEKLRLKCDVILSVPTFWETKIVSSNEETGPQTRLDAYSSVQLKPKQRIQTRQEFEVLAKDVLGEVSFFPITEEYTQYKPDSLFMKS